MRHSVSSWRDDTILSVTDRGARGWWWMIFNDGEITEKVRSTGGRSFQKPSAVMDMARLENMRWDVTGVRERVRQDDDRVERVGWMVKSSRRYVGWEDAKPESKQLLQRVKTIWKIRGPNVVSIAYLSLNFSLITSNQVSNLNYMLCWNVQANYLLLSTRHSSGKSLWIFLRL